MKKTESFITFPLVTIIIPCFNSEDFILECIDSVLKQNYSSIEIIVIDDGSTDNTVEKLRKYEATEHIYILQQDNQGACVARNKGLFRSKGKYIKFLDSDDLLEPFIIDQQVQLSETLDSNAIVYGDYYLLEGNRKKYIDTSLPDGGQTELLVLHDILTSTPLHRKWMLDKISGFDERFRNGQEWNLHIRLSSEGYLFYHQSIPIFCYRIHKSPNRITNMKKAEGNNLLYEAKKVEMTIEKLSDNFSGDPNAAFSYKYWVIARKLYRIGDNRYKDFIFKAKNVSNNYQKHWKTKNKFLFKLFGFNAVESYYRLFKKH
ncbi:glycosyltransferase family 2 protein [Psychrobacter sp. LV10R520-6]|uniref:glycosyltransferase family 2 protein n=1 Tax=Psychrobacter sp. LV10R520-6 TaxID=1415574 RepID=UPI0024C9DCDB|nr:glycosyltransferase [Psychrobacter sp. LV10R520-6]SNT69962.1 Glycosyltransferase involved in cell wall bisynthesis [Psychrobacter sp. LV10R520-6]